jgi:hypothetical protein
LTSPGGPERMSHPFTNRYPLTLSYPADLVHLGIRQKDLQSLTHNVSIA